MKLKHLRSDGTRGSISCCQRTILNVYLSCFQSQCFKIVLMFLYYCTQPSYYFLPLSTRLKQEVMSTTSLEDFRSRSLWLAVSAECLGTCWLVLLGCGSCLHGMGHVGISLCFGLTIVAVVWAIADVSGGHINPAVTLAFCVTRHITVIRAILYIIAQVRASLASIHLILSRKRI